MNPSFRRIDHAVLTSLTCGDRSGGDERFSLASQRTGAIKIALQASLQTSEAVEEVRRLIQLIVAFDGALESPSVAQAMRQIVQSDPDAMALIRTHFTPKARIGALPQFTVPPRHQAALRAVLHSGAGPAAPNGRGTGFVSDAVSAGLPLPTQSGALQARVED